MLGTTFVIRENIGTQVIMVQVACTSYPLIGLHLIKSTNDIGVAEYGRFEDF